MEPGLVFAIGALVAGSLGGWLLGHLTGPNRQARKLAEQIESLHKECEVAASELMSAKAELDRARDELEDYRDRVSSHFSGASDRFRELTLQYRALFDHLSEGARDLCPENFPALEDLSAPALGGPPEAEPGTGGEAPPAP